MLWTSPVDIMISETNHHVRGVQAKHPGRAIVPMKSRYDQIEQSIGEV